MGAPRIVHPKVDNVAAVGKPDNIQCLVSDQFKADDLVVVGKKLGRAGREGLGIDRLADVQGPDGPKYCGKAAVHLVDR